MTYLCGVAFPGVGRDPQVVCDGGGAVKLARSRGAAQIAPAWLLDSRAPPGWRLERQDLATGVYRRDWCPACKVGR